MGIPIAAFNPPNSTSQAIWKCPTASPFILRINSPDALFCWANSSIRRDIWDLENELGGKSHHHPFHTVLMTASICFKLAINHKHIVAFLWLSYPIATFIILVQTSSVSKPIPQVLPFPPELCTHCKTFFSDTEINALPSLQCACWMEEANHL